MTGDIFGLDGLTILVFLAVGLVVPIWALIDAGTKTSTAFTAAGSSKGMWIALIAIFWFLTGIVGVVLAIVYLTAIRPRVVAAIGSQSAGTYRGQQVAGGPGYGYSTQQPPQAPNPPLHQLAGIRILQPKSNAGGTGRNGVPPHPTERWGFCTGP